MVYNNSWFNTCYLLKDRKESLATLRREIKEANRPFRGRQGNILTEKGAVQKE